MLLKEIKSFSNVDVLNFLDILGNPTALITSFNKNLQEMKFDGMEIEDIDNSHNLRAFEYYNESILRYF
jgi:hypothetical protein